MIRSCIKKLKELQLRPRIVRRNIGEALPSQLVELLTCNYRKMQPMSRLVFNESAQRTGPEKCAQVFQPNLK
jgi:hypothetical protein